MFKVESAIHHLTLDIQHFLITFPVRRRPVPACCRVEFYSVWTDTRLCASHRSAQGRFLYPGASVPDDRAPREADGRSRVIDRPRRLPATPQKVRIDLY